MIKQKNNMKLTIDNLIFFLEKEYPYDLNLTTQTTFRQSEANIDGIDAVNLLENLSKEFNVTFENFDFHQYFLDEAELDTMTWKHLFKLKKQREIQEELTIQMLFDYMITNPKSPE